MQAGTCFLFLPLLRSPICGAMCLGTSVRTSTDLSTMDFSAGHCPDALITLYYNLNLNTPLLTQGQCSWGNPSNVTQDDILMSLKCRYFKFLIFLTLTIIRLCPKKKKALKYHISRGTETNHESFSNSCPSQFSLKLLRNWKFSSPWRKARDKFVTSVAGKRTAWAGTQTTQYQTVLWKVCATKLWRNTLQCLSYTWIFFFWGGGIIWQGIRIFSKILDAYMYMCIWMRVGATVTSCSFKPTFCHFVDTELEFQKHRISSTFGRINNAQFLKWPKVFWWKYW